MYGSAVSSIIKDNSLSASRHTVAYGDCNYLLIVTLRYVTILHVDTALPQSCTLSHWGTVKLPSGLLFVCCLQDLLDQLVLEVLPQLAPLATLSQGCCQALLTFCGLAAAAASPRDSITAFLEVMDQLLAMHRCGRRQKAATLSGEVDSSSTCVHDATYCSTMADRCSTVDMHFRQ